MNHLPNPNPEQDLLLSSLIGIQSCYREVSSSGKSNESGVQVVWVGQQPVEIYPEMIAYEILIRCDIYEEKIVEITEQLTLSYSAKVMKHLPSKMTDADSAPKSPILHVFNDSAEETKKLWNEILILIGCNSNFERVVFLLVVPATATTSSSSSTSTTTSSNLVKKTLSTFMNQNMEFVNFCSTLVVHFTEAYYGENITVFNDVIARNLDRSTPSYHKYVCEGIIDLAFIRDLQLTASQLMNALILKEVNHLDTQVLKLQEMKCAKLMTLLKPYYQKASIALPVVPTSKPLSSYPLMLSRDSIREPSVETSRLLLLKARKQYRSLITTESQKPTLSHESPEYLSHDYQVSFLTNNIITQLKEWSEEEYHLRMKRKLSSVKDRLEQLNQFKIQLILTLHNRFVENGVQSVNQYGTDSSTSSFGSGLAAAATSLWPLRSWGGISHTATSPSSSSTSTANNTSNLPPIILTADYQLHVSLRDKFAFLDVDEPIIVESQGFLTQYSPHKEGTTAVGDSAVGTSIVNRKGTIYITIGNFMFYSVSTLLSNPAIVVIPFKIISKMDLWKTGKVLLSQQYNINLLAGNANSLQPVVIPTSEELSNPLVEEGPTTTKPIVLPLSALTGTVSVINPGTDLSAIGFDDAISVVDIAGQQTILKFSELTPDYIFRIFDLLDLLLREKLFDLRYKQKRPVAAPSQSTTTTTTNVTTVPLAATHSESITEQQIDTEIERLEQMISTHQVFEHNQQLPEHQSTVTKTTATSAVTGSRFGEESRIDEHLLEFEEQTEISKLSEFFGTVSHEPMKSDPSSVKSQDANHSSSTADQAHQIQATVTSPSSVQPKDSTQGKSKRNLAGGIQKFLSQSQIKTKTASSPNMLSSNSDENNNVV